MKLEEFNRVGLKSSFRATAWEFKNLNLHRVIVELTGGGEPFADREFNQLRQEIASHFQISKLRGFGFGIILNNFEVQDDQLPAWVDNSTKGGRACQWVVASCRSQKRITGCHMWQKGTTTAIFEGELCQGANEGFTVTKHVKPPEGLMKLAAMFSPALKLSRYKRVFRKFLQRVLMTEATPIQVGCRERRCEVEFGHEFPPASRWHQPPARTVESLRPGWLHRRDLPARFHRRSAACFECGATVAHPFVGRVDFHPFAQSRRGATARTGRVAAVRPVAPHAAHCPDAA